MSNGGVWRESDDEFVELPGGVGERDAVADEFGRRLDVGAEDGDDQVAAVSASGAFGGAQRFERLQPGGQVAERDSTGLKGETEVVGGGRLVWTMDLRAADIASPDGDQPFGLEDPDRLANGRVAHPELLHQLVLGGQSVRVRVGTGQDAITQRGGDALGDPELWDTTVAAGRHTPSLLSL